MSEPPADDSRPAFARRYPSHSELDALVAAFARGDFRHVRVGAESLSREAADESVRRAALDLRRRLDPSASTFVLLALGAVLALALFAYHRAHLPH